MSIAREIVCEAKRRGDIIGLPSLISIDEDILEALIAAKLAEANRVRDKRDRLLIATLEAVRHDVSCSSPALLGLARQHVAEALALLEGGDDEDGSD